MRRLLFFVLLTVAIASCKAPESIALKGTATQEIRAGWTQGSESFSHEQLDTLLRKHVDPATNRVDYAGLARDESELDAYLQRVATARLGELPRDEQLALLINAYNAYTLRLILNHYPIDSIRSIDDPWGKARYVVGGHELSLDNIEHNLIRPLFKDPRIHFAVNCAAVGCPPLRPHAYSAAKLDEQLDAAESDALGDPRYLQHDAGKLRVTRIFDWYGGDFVEEGWKGSEARLSTYIGKRAPADVARAIAAKPDIEVEFLDYDWALNDARR